MNTARTLMLVATGIGIVVYISWLLLMAFFSLMAESGGKDSEPLLALALLWPLGELIWTWAWVARHGERYSRSALRGLGDALFIVALVVPPPLSFWLGGKLRWAGRPQWELEIIIPIAITVAACWAARLVWAKPGQLPAETASPVGSEAV